MPRSLTYRQDRPWTGYYQTKRNYDTDITGDPNAKFDFLSRFDPTLGGMAGSQFDFSSPGAGTGLYGSDLLDKLAGRATSDLQNPETSLGMGLLKDQFTGQRNTAQQELNDRYAGYGRGSGPQAAQQLALADTMNKNESSSKRQMLSDLLQSSISNAMGIEGLRSGNYNDQQHRLGQDQQMRWSFADSANSQKANMMKTLADFLRGNSGDLAGNQQQSLMNRWKLDDFNAGVDQGNWSTQRRDDANMKKWADTAGTALPRVRGR